LCTKAKTSKMRKLIYAINITIDGCCDHTKFYPDETTMVYFINLLRNTDTFLYGRKTYELMVPYWPDVLKNATDDRDVDIEFARAFDAVNKIVVFSRSLGSVNDGKTTVINTDLEKEIRKLKQQEGGDIMTGGIDLPTQLIALGLIDEFYFIVHPIIISEGRRLFDGTDLQEKSGLELVDTTVFQSGCVGLHYRKL